MPELPDVEGQRAALAEQLPGALVLDVQVLDSGVLRNSTAAALRDRLMQHRFRTPWRHGKWLMLPTDGPTLVIHNGMTGRPSFMQASAVIDRYLRLVVFTDKGELRYSDLRKLRGVWLAEDDAEITLIIGEQGPDALTISLPDLRAALRRRRAALKTSLMNQQVVAGIGNMLSDEICWRAQLHPARVSTTLDSGEVRRLHAVMRRTLKAAVKEGRIPRTQTWLNSARDRETAACPRCDTSLDRTVIGGRTSIWCQHCQALDRSDRLDV